MKTRVDLRVAVVKNTKPKNFATNNTRGWERNDTGRLKHCHGGRGTKRRGVRDCDGVSVLALPPGLFVGQWQYWTVERVTGVTVYTKHAKLFEVSRYSAGCRYDGFKNEVLLVNQVSFYLWFLCGFRLSGNVRARLALRLLVSIDCRIA